ncbi:MAG: N-acetyltransferase family protein [Rhodospirillales bacterium]|nr:MAG: N-acetyltransferase family protein [Rhodospirillales bacterium]
MLRAPRPLGRLRDATDADIGRIRAIYAEHVAHGTGSFEEVPPDLAEMQARFEALQARELPFLVVEDRGQVQGFAYAAPFRPRSAYRYTVEDSIYIAPEATGRGLGRRLLAELIGQCTVLGYRQMVAVVGDSGNHRSIRLHESLGFRRTGTFTAVGFKFGRWLDAVFMQRSLWDGSTSPGR